MEAKNITNFERFLAASWPGRISWAQPSWEIRFADGYTKRANSLWIFDPLNAPQSRASLLAWKAWINSHGQPFYLKPAAHPDWFSLIKKWNLGTSSDEDPSRVYYLDLSSRLPPCPPLKNLSVLEEAFPCKTWLKSFDHGKHFETQGGLKSILQALGSNSTVFTLLEDSLPIGWTQLSVIGDLAAVASVHVLEEFRGKGRGRFLMLKVLETAIKKGASSCLLQVREGNEAAKKLYQGLGFQDVYGYHYIKME